MRGHGRRRRPARRLARDRGQYVIRQEPSRLDRQTSSTSAQIDFDALKRRLRHGQTKHSHRTPAAPSNAASSHWPNSTGPASTTSTNSSESIDGVQHRRPERPTLLRTTPGVHPELNAEEQRAHRPGTDEESGAIFDLLTRPDPDLSAKEEAQVHTVARQLSKPSNTRSSSSTGARNNSPLRRPRHHRRGARNGLPLVYTANDYQQAAPTSTSTSMTPTPTQQGASSPSQPTAMSHRTLPTSQPQCSLCYQLSKFPVRTPLTHQNICSIVGGKRHSE